MLLAGLANNYANYARCHGFGKPAAPGAANKTNNNRKGKLAAAGKSPLSRGTVAVATSPNRRGGGRLAVVGRKLTTTRRRRSKGRKQATVAAANNKSNRNGRKKLAMTNRGAQPMLRAQARPGFSEG